MVWLYRLIFWPLFVLLLPKYFIRLWQRGGNWHMAERFGKLTPPAKRAGVERVWIQAVSVGELNAIKPLLETLAANPAVEVVLSTTTTTGYKLAQDKYSKLVSYLFTFPIDIFAAQTFKQLQPDKLILMEGELWPETLHQAAKSKVPVYLINARLSDRSFKRMSAMKPLAQWMLKRLSLVLAGSKLDAERYLNLGANPELVAVTGNLKFDVINPKSFSDEEKAKIVKSLGFEASHTILIGSSTWEGEEEALMAAYKDLRTVYPQLRLLIVPRHAERRGAIEPLIKATGLPYHRRAAGPVTGSPEIVLADTTGELASLVAVSDIVFVGKSLPPHKEGQTPIEAAALGKPVIMGPQMTNFKTIANSLTDACGGVRVGGPVELKLTIAALLADSRKRQAMGEAAGAWFSTNRGATAKTLEWLNLSNPVTTNTNV